MTGVGLRISGGSGPGEKDAFGINHWTLHYGEDSSVLRNIVDLTTEWHTDSHPPWAVYHVLMAGYLIGMYNHPRVRRVGIGDTMLMICKLIPGGGRPRGQRDLWDGADLCWVGIWHQRGDTCDATALVA